MIVNSKLAEEARVLLVQIARVAHERWDEPAMARLDNWNDTVVQDAYRTAARYTHPDSGGSIEQFAAVDRAKHILLEYIRRRQPESTAPLQKIDCHKCGGTGIIKSHRGFGAPLRKQCPQCRGTGDLAYEHDGSNEQ